MTPASRRSSFHPTFTFSKVARTMKMAVARRRWLAAVLGLLVTPAVQMLASPAFAENWPNWRGPRNDSTTSETGLPLYWSEIAGVVWKTALPGEGASTPAIWGDAVFVTAQQDDKLLLLRLNKSNGRIVWTRQVGTTEGTVRQADRGKQKFHRLHNEASPSPVTDGEIVVAHFGNGDLAAYDFDGNQLWKRNLQDDHGPYTVWWGHANSPVIYRDLVIVVCMQDPIDDLGTEPAKSYLEAYNKRNGRVRWTTSRMTGAKAESADSYTTPLLRVTPKGDELIVMGGNQLDAYNPATGEQLWWMDGLQGGRTITGPTITGPYVFATRGMRGATFAVRIDNVSGKLDRRHLAWQDEGATPDSCTPVAWNDLIFTITDNGIAKCIDARTGGVKWRHRLKGEYKASPIAAEGRVYFLNQQGLCTIVSAQLGFNQLAENQLNDETLASPAISDGKLFIRGKKYLYCIAK